MIRFACLTLLALASTAMAADKPDTAAILGKWKVTSATFDGKDMPLPKGGAKYLSFDEKEFTAFDGEKKGRVLAYSLDPSKAPKEFDATLNADQKAAGYYILDGDRLTLYYGEPGAARPAKPETKAGGKVFVMELERVKK